MFQRLTTLLPRKTFSNSINTALLNNDVFVNPADVVDFLSIVDKISFDTALRLVYLQQ